MSDLFNEEYDRWPETAQCLQEATLRMKWEDDHGSLTSRESDTRFRRRLLFFLALAVALALLFGSLLFAGPVGASDPALSNVPVGAAPDLFVWTTSDDSGWYYTTDCERTTHHCRTVALPSEQGVVDWVLRLQQEFTVEYLS